MRFPPATRRFAALILLALALTDFASAHESGLSAMSATLTPDGVEIVNTYARRDIEGFFLPFDDPPPTREQLLSLAVDAVAVTEAGRPVAPSKVDVNPDAPNNDIEFRLTFPSAGARDKWKVRAALIDRLTVGHRQYFSQTDATGKVRGEQLLRAGADTVEIDARPVPLARVLGRGATYFAFVLLGMNHILTGVDHLLFVLGLVLIVRNGWMLLKTITAFTIAHSITLAIATLGYPTPPAALLNVAIAFSIFFLGPEIFRASRGGTSFTLRNPWIVAFAFGLLHGFGFASGLLDLGIPRAQVPPALLFFNVGVEAGQLAFVLLILALERSFRALQICWARWAADLPAYTVGALGALWTIQRLWILLAPAR